MSEDVKRMELASTLRAVMRQLDRQLADLRDAVERMKSISKDIDDLQSDMRSNASGLRAVDAELKEINDRLNAVVDLAAECSDGSEVAKEVEKLREYLNRESKPHRIDLDDIRDDVLGGCEYVCKRILMVTHYFVEAANEAMKALEENRRQLMALAGSLGMGDAAARAEEDAKGWAETVLNLTKRLMESLGIREEAKPS